MYTVTSFYFVFVLFQFNLSILEKYKKVKLGDFGGNYGFKFLFLSNRYGGVAYVDERHRHRYEVS